MFVRFRSWDCVVRGEYYSRPSNRKALILNDLDGECPDNFVAIATVNLPHVSCEENEVFIKEYSENQGMTDVLVRAGVIEQVPVSSHPSGFVQINKHRLTDEAMKKLFDQ